MSGGDIHAPPVDRLIRCIADRPGAWVIARAPGRLDVMGGIADYSGSLVCEMPLAIAAAAAVRRRTDGRVVMASEQAALPVTLPGEALMQADPLAVRREFSGEQAWARYVAGCLWWLFKHRGADASGGVDIVVASDVPLGGGVSSSAAIEVATMTALASICGVRLDPLELAAACQTVENLVVGAPCGVMDQVTSTLGTADTLLEILCQTGRDGLPAQVRGTVAIPAGHAFVGLHSGVRHEVVGDPYADTRVAAFMGQKILSLLESPDLTGGHLANVDAERYRTLRDRLPAEFGGAAFLAAYGGTDDPVTSVDPGKTYHVRNATDHHVLEMARVASFLELLKEGDWPGGTAASQAGALMNASHRSYGDCARLGHAMTDLIVEKARSLGPEAGVYGAKITGGGCGGTVAILIRDEPRAWASLDRLKRSYEADTGRQATLFVGSGPGAAAWGVVHHRVGEMP